MADITVIGGINIDIEGRPFEALKYEDSNPGSITLSYGGVGRNITENIARLGVNATMISVIGEDQMGNGARAELQSMGVDVSNVEILKGRNSAMYLSVLNDKNDMEIALCDMDIVKIITPEFLEKKKDVLQNSKVIAVDGNLTEETLEYVTANFPNAKLFFDPVSSAKAMRAKKVIGKFTCIKPNIMEAEALSGIKIKTEDDVKNVGQWFVNKGVKKVFITLNRDGVYYKDSEKEGFIRPKDVKINSATGAGDSFSATILIGMLKDRDIEEMAKYGMAAAQITMESSNAVSKNMNKEEIERRISNV